MNPNVQESLQPLPVMGCSLKAVRYVSVVLVLIVPLVLVSAVATLSVLAAAITSVAVMVLHGWFIVGATVANEAMRRRINNLQSFAARVNQVSERFDRIAETTVDWSERCAIAEGLLRAAQPSCEATRAGQEIEKYIADPTGYTRAAVERLGLKIAVPSEIKDMFSVPKIDTIA